MKKTTKQAERRKQTRKRPKIAE
jgi:hypothetical protein